jgi:hypothetical protein
MKRWSDKNREQTADKLIFGEWLGDESTKSSASQEESAIGVQQLVQLVLNARHG